MDSFLGQFQSPSNLPSALEQIRAFTEKNNVMPDPNVNLASALGVMSQTMLGSPDKVYCGTRSHVPIAKNGGRYVSIDA